MTAGWLVARPAPYGRRLLVQAGTFALMGAAPDLDLLIGRHSGETHSLGAAAIVATLAATLRWPVAVETWRIWLAVFLAWATHPLLDSLGLDTKVPIGVMAFWPISRDHFNSGLDIFLPIYRSCCSSRSVVQNSKAMLWEVVILLPVALGAWWARSPGKRK
jgi:membrane-bound metal-dependent hydrolase YbcI (DUF457 family)